MSITISSRSFSYILASVPCCTSGSLLTQRGLYKNARRAPARICIPTRPSPACPLQILLGTLPLPDADCAGRQAAHEAGRQLAWIPVELLDGLTDGACWAILSVHLRPASLFPQG